MLALSFRNLANDKDTTEQSLVDVALSQKKGEKGIGRMSHNKINLSTEPIMYNNIDY